jgi:toxin-antitoxin system PIN domain toxin
MKKTRHLPDINVWLAFADRAHQHHAAAKAWYSQHSQEGMAFCRNTQQGFLRLLTNKLAMKAGCLTMIQAWNLYDRIAANPGVAFWHEPAGIEVEWRNLTQK